MANIQIEFESKNDVFKPGDTINGKVVIDVPVGFKARKVRLELIGKSFTFWEGEVKSNTKIKGSDIVRVRHNCADHKAKILYIRQEKVLWKSEDSRHEMPANVYKFQFNFQLPVYCPPSFESVLGCIRYYVKAEIDRPWKFDDKFVKAFTLLPTINLEMIPRLQISLRRHICQEIRSILRKKGMVKMEATIEKQGFVCGEKVPVTVKIMNESSKKFSKLLLRMVQRATYTGFRDGFSDSSEMPVCDENQQKQKIKCSTKLNAQVRVEERIFAEEMMNVSIRETSTTSLDVSLNLPPVCPSIKTCDIIEVSYFLKIKLSSTGTFNTTIKLEIPFIIGTVPFSKCDQTKIDYKISCFGYNSTHLKCRNLVKFAPKYPVYSLGNSKTGNSE